MKKLILFLFLFFSCSCFFYNNQPKQFHEFEFRGGSVLSGGGYVCSVSHVVVNVDPDDLPDLYTRIHSQYIRMNGQPDELVFYLYDSVENLHASRLFSSKTYKKPDPTQ